MCCGVCACAHVLLWSILHCRFAFPQYLLSSHFLTEEQKVEVVRKGLAQRRQSMEQLMQSVEKVAQGAKLHVCSCLCIAKIILYVRVCIYVHRQHKYVFHTDTYVQAHIDVCQL